MSEDGKLIKSLGGPAKVAEMLGYEKHGGTQRVQNWIARGIPARVRLDHPDVFRAKNEEAGNQEASKAA